MRGIVLAISSVRSVRLFIRGAIVACLLVYSAALVNAQTTSATVVGTLTDSSGARVAGGSVVVRDLATGIEQRAVTDSQGEYVIPDLKAAHYSDNVFHDGFSALCHVGC